MPVRKAGKLDQMEAKIENGIKEGLILSGELVAQRAKVKARVKTGRMKRNIHRGNPQQVSRGWMITVGGNVFYLPYHEFGTGDKAEDPGKSKNPARPGISPQPMLRPALKESRDDVVKLIKARVIASARR